MTLTFKKYGVDLNGGCLWLLQSLSTEDTLDDVPGRFALVRTSAKGENLPHGYSIAPDVRLVCVDFVTETLRSHPANWNLKMEIGIIYLAVKAL